MFLLAVLLDNRNDFYLKMKKDYQGFGYNMALIEYPNGSAQIRIYDKPLVSFTEKSSEDIYTKDPFHGSLVREVEDIVPPIDALESRRISLSRTKRMISDYARCFRWEWFCTFTFSKDKANRTDYKECCKKIRTWLKNARDRKAPELAYLVVPELHKDMESWHMHALLGNTGEIKFSNSGIIKNGRIIYNISGWTQGFSTATKVTDIYRLQKYILKYMTKECHVMAKGWHRYYVSDNLPKPKKSIFVVENGTEEKLTNEIADILGKKVSWVSHSRNIPGTYMGVTYIELQPYEK